MRNDWKARSAPTVAALLLLAVFAAGILGVLLGGAAAYRRLNQQDQRSFESRTCLQYLATRVRQASGPDAVSIAPFGQVDALVIRQELEGEVFLTRVYCYDGWLMELFSFAEGEQEPRDGEKIMPLSVLTMELQQGLFTAAVSVQGEELQCLTLSLRGGEEMLP